MELANTIAVIPTSDLGTLPLLLLVEIQVAMEITAMVREMMTTEIMVKVTVIAMEVEILSTFQT